MSTLPPSRREFGLCRALWRHRAALPRRLRAVDCGLCDSCSLTPLPGSALCVRLLAFRARRTSTRCARSPPLGDPLYPVCALHSPRLRTRKPPQSGVMQRRRPACVLSPVDLRTVDCISHEYA